MHCDRRAGVPDPSAGDGDGERDRIPDGCRLFLDRRKGDLPPESRRSGSVDEVLFEDQLYTVWYTVDSILIIKYKPTLCD